MRRMIRVALADDHAIVREGVQRVLAEASDIEVVTQASDGAEILDRLREVPVDVLVLDLSMPGRGGLDVLRQLRASHPRLRVLVLTMHHEDQYAVRALRSGAHGYLTKDSAGTELVDAVRRVAAGQRYMTPHVAELLLDEHNNNDAKAPHTSLSDREYQVFELLVGGTSVTEIAQRLCLSVKTVSTHKTHVQQKLGAVSVADLVRYALQHRIGG
jgi:DNA-binding NarL/FixJ family response regulator